MSSAHSPNPLQTQAGLFEPLPVVEGHAPARSMTFEEKVALAVAAIKQQVLQGRHLVVAWSGGKDSSVTLSLAFTALRELRANGHVVPQLHVVHANTTLENPVIEAYNNGQVKSVAAYAKSSGLPTRVWIASPSLSNDYLVALLGGRTIMSLKSNTKCQQMMKASALDRIKRQVRAAVAESEGVKPREAHLVSLIGTRVEESLARAAMMKARGESSTEAVDAMGDGHLVLSPIADWTAFDIFTYIGQVRSGRIEAYDSFDDLVEIYRDANGGDCMVTAYIAKREQTKPPCSARSGCWICTRVSKDTFADNMIASDGGKYEWMRPLRDLRAYMLARHFDPAARCWLARSVDEETGKVKIVPNAYAPAYTLELLRLILTIQIREQNAARRLGIAPRFQLLDERQLIALDLLWGRYQYQRSFMALRTWKEIYEGGARYDLPDLASIPAFTEKDVAFRAEAPFADEEYFSPWRGFRNVEAAAADWEETTTLPNGNIVQGANLGDEFDVDEEGAALFWEFEMDYALDRISILDNPAAVVHYLVGLGTVTLYKGGLGEWDRMMRVGNQAWAHGLMPILNDPHALLSTLNGRFQVEEELNACPLGQQASAERQLALQW